MSTVSRYLILSFFAALAFAQNSPVYNVGGTVDLSGATAVKAPTVPSTDKSTAVATTSFVAGQIASLNQAVSVQAATVTVLPDAPTYSNGTAGVGATLTATTHAALVIDGYTVLLNDRVLINNQATAYQNGVYTVTTLGSGSVYYVLTRATDFNTVAQINGSGAIPVLNGTVNNNTLWVLNLAIVTIGTTPINYSLGTTTAFPVLTVANAASTGTTLNKLSKLTGAPSTAVRTATTDTSGAIGICTSGCGTSGAAQISESGIVACIFDGATTAGDYVQISSGTAGDCTDAGATIPSTGEILGRVLTTNAGAGTYSVLLFSPDVASSVVSPLPAARGGTGVANAATLTLGSSNQNWASLGTGIVKNTTTTGAISDAAYGDVVGLFGSGSCSGYLKSDGTCSTPSSGVTSFSGDGSLINNSSSTGVVTATLANATAHKWWGNNTGSTGTPGYDAIGSSDLVGTYVAGGGSANAQTATFSPAMTSLVAGLQGCWLPTAANTTTTPTFAPSSLTAKTIVKAGGAALAASDLTTTAIACAIYDGTYWELQNPQTGVGTCAGISNAACTNGANIFTTGTQTITTGSPTTVGAVVRATSGTATAAYVQSANGSGNTNNIAFGSNTTAGNAIVVVYQGIGSGFSCTVSDTQSNTFTAVPSYLITSPYAFGALVAVNIVGGADTVSLSCGGNYTGAAILEYANVALVSPFNAHTSRTNNPWSNPEAIGPITTSGATLMISVVGSGCNGCSTASTSISGYTIRQNFSPAASSMAVADTSLSTSGSYSATWSNTAYTGIFNLGLFALTAGSTPQSADLHEWQDSSGAVLSKVDANGLYSLAALTAVATLIPGTSVTSVTCNTAACTAQRGTFTVVGGAATTGTIVAMSWGATATASACIVTENGNTVDYGIGHSVATTTGMNITAAVSVASATLVIDYLCTP